MTISPALQQETLNEKINTLQHKRIPGQYEGKFTIPKDFNEPVPEIIGQV
jgi:hypothetical protein